MRLLWTKANYIYHRHEYDKNTVGKDVKCRHFIAYWVIGLHWWCQIEIDKKCKRQLVNSDRVRTNFTLVVNIGPVLYTFLNDHVSRTYSMLIRDFGDILRNRQVDMLGTH